MGDNEHALRAHIRNLLLDYCRTHLTIDHVKFTRQAASELLAESLNYIPTHDPASLLLPTDPFDFLAKKWRLDSIEEYEEHPVVSAEALQYVKQKLPRPGKPKSSTIWDEAQDVDYERWLSRRPMSPVLTAYALRETPKLGSRSAADMGPKSHTGFLDSYGIHPVKVEDDEEQPRLDLDDALDNKPSMNAETYAAVTESIRFAARQLNSRDSAPGDNAYARDFLRADSPIPMPAQLDSPPLFARDRLPGHRPNALVSYPHPAGLKSMSDLPALVPKVEIKKEDEEEDLYKEHLIVVNGWQAYNVPSSPSRTPSLGGSSSEIDELFPPSPENTQLFIESLASAQMDEYELPRSEKVGRARVRPKVIGEGESLGSFLGSLLQPHQVRKERAQIVTTPKSYPSSPHTTITMSMLGQPPSVLEDEFNIGDAAPDNFRGYMSDPDLEDIVGRLCGGVPDEDLTDVIIREKIDEKYCLLMDVPELPPPNVHPPSIFLPKKLSDLVAVPEPLIPSTSHDKQPFEGLRKAKGLRSLTMELTWMPFKYGRTIPTDEDCAGVTDANSIRDAILKWIGDDETRAVTELQRLLEEALSLDTDLDAETSCPPSMHGWWDGGSAADDLRSGDYITNNIILTRMDRRKANGLSGDAFGNLSQDEDASVDEVDQRKKRVKFDDHHRTADGPAHYGDDLHQVDDSGILMVEPDCVNGSDNVFSQLALGAEGFEGALADGDLFRDIDPIHHIDHASASPRALRYSPMVSARYNAHSTYEVTTAAVGLPEQHYHHEGELWPVNDAENSAAFMPLSFDSAHVPIAPHTPEPDAPSPRRYGFAPDVDPSQRNVLISADGRESPNVSSTTLIQAPARGISGFSPMTSARQSLADFLKFRGKSFATTTNADPHSALNAQLSVPAVHDSATSRDIPEELLDSRTLRLHDHRTLPTTVHRYMASMDFIQKRALVVALSSSECLVDLTERERLGDVELIVDPDTAILFSTLAALPSELDSLMMRLTQLSWRYMHLLVILEAYPPSSSYRHDHDSSTAAPYAFSPPVVKAVKKLRRDLSIADACRSKCSMSTVHFAFANTVEEAAMFTRVYGDIAQDRDATGGAIWGAREWLDLDEQDGELDLAGVDGMNMFAASIVLCQISLEDFLDQTPEERLDYYAALVGTERITRFNEEFTRRSAAMELHSSPLSSVHDQSDRLPLAEDS
ncbi:hypothetical protein SCP_0103390 [Sparassis crispa]|uniref:Uncharacterized protein n=1 Tax=Sparassis crispa TaxID=139825 RepID=A0A401G5N2_9APHY|nr:hypothetical protein SCP_0103390 [Sparassis crispa]GBE77464.1 hypothetical protein SCP_0103390 [Sparassis crispa]